MKDRLKKALSQIKNFIDAWKIWLFFLALFGTNGLQAGLQEYARSEPEKPVEKPTIIKPTNLQKTIIIHKFDAELAKKLIKLELDKHKNGSQH